MHPLFWWTALHHALSDVAGADSIQRTLSKVVTKLNLFCTSHVLSFFVESRFKFILSLGHWTLPYTHEKVFPHIPVICYRYVYGTSYMYGSVQFFTSFSCRKACSSLYWIVVVATTSCILSWCSHHVLFSCSHAVLDCMQIRTVLYADSKIQKMFEHFKPHVAFCAIVI